MTALLIAALVAPVAGAVGTVVLPSRAPVLVRASAVVAAGCWLGLLLHGSLVNVGPLHSVPLVAAAGFGAAALTAAARGLDRRTPIANLAACLCLAAAGLGVAAGRVTTDGLGLVVGLGVAAAAGLWADGAGRRAWVIAVLGVAVSVVGVVALRSAAGSWHLGAPGLPGSYRSEGLVVLAGAALLVVAGSRRACSSTAVLVPSGLFLAAGCAPLVHGAAGHAATAIVVGGVACVAAGAARGGRPLLDRPSAALALVAVAALVAPGPCRPAALLLASAATLAAALGVPASAALGVPGFISLAIALAARGGASTLVFGVLAGGVALALAATAARKPVPRPSWWTLPVLAAGAWLLVAPNTWSWVGAPGLRAYDLGAARAAGAAALVFVGLSFRDRAGPGWYARLSPSVTARSSPAASSSSAASSNSAASSGEDAVRH